MKALATLTLSVIVLFGTVTVPTAQADDTAPTPWFTYTDLHGDPQACLDAEDCAYQFLTGIRNATYGDGACLDWCAFRQKMLNLERDLWVRINTQDDAKAALAWYPVMYQGIQQNNPAATGALQFFKQLWDRAEAYVAAMFDQTTHDYIGPPPVIPDPTVASSAASLTAATIKVSDQVWTGAQLTPAVTVVLSGTILTLGTDYTVTYGNNVGIGLGSVGVYGSGSYASSQPAGTFFRIIPTTPKVTKVKAYKKAFRVYWKKVSSLQKITGYQVQYRLVGTSTWKIKTVSAASSSKKVTGLKRKKVYEVQVRAYKTVGAVKYYAAWSPMKSQKVK